MKLQNIGVYSFVFILLSCATTPDYKPIVDTSGISDLSQYQKDYLECERVTNSVDYSDEETVAAIKGAAVGAGVTL